MAAEGFVDPRKSKLRYQIAAVLVAIGATLLFIGLKIETRQYLIPAATERHPEHGFTRVWLDNADLPVGANQQGSRLAITRWSGGNWQFDIGAPGETPAWTAAPDLSRLAWISGNTLYCRVRPLEAGSAQPAAAPLPAGKKALALTALSDGSVAVVFDDASAGRWDCSDGRSLDEKQLDFENPEQAAAQQDYVALGSARSGNIILFHYRPGQDWEVADREPAPDLPFRLIIPAPGVVAALSEAGLHRGNTVENAPGAIRAAASHLEDFIVTGDFDNALVLPADGEPYMLADAKPGSLLAASHEKLVVSGPDETRLITLSAEIGLTAKGRTFARTGGLLLALASLVCFGPMLLVKLLDLLASLTNRSKDKSGNLNVPTKFDRPPGDLIQAFAAGEGVVWAGAGLSAQSGMPLRASFIQGILQAAKVENLAPAALLQRVEELIRKGDGETALDELVAGVPRRSDLIAHYRAVYYKYVARSRTHELIARIPLTGVITTNYDGLLECLGAPWSSAVATPSALLPTGWDAPFLLKLYGDLPEPSTVLLSRFEFAAAFPKSGVAHVPRNALAERTMLFVGSSLEGLLADLNVTGGPEQISRAHFAAVAVSGTKWTKTADTLKQKFGVQVLPCSAETIREALPAFLEDLLLEIEKLRQMQPSQAPVLSSGTPK